MKVAEGFHVTVLAYGQTGSGKTHTMEGFAYEQHADPKRAPKAHILFIYIYIYISMNLGVGVGPSGNPQLSMVGLE